MAIIYVMGALFTLSLIASGIYVYLMNKKHKKRLDVQKDRFNSQEHSEDEKQGFMYLLMREKNYIHNFITFQVVGKICEMLSIVFSVSSLLFTYMKDECEAFAIWKQVIPIMSIVFIIVVIYIVPSRRWAEYMRAWRTTDDLVNRILAGKAHVNDAPEELKKTEESITSDLV